MKIVVKLFFLAFVLPCAGVGIVMGLGFFGLIMGWKLASDLIDWITGKT